MKEVFLRRATSVFTVLLVFGATLSGAFCASACTPKVTGHACCAAVGAHTNSDHPSLAGSAACDHLPAFSEAVSSERPEPFVSLTLHADGLPARSLNALSEVAPARSEPQSAPPFIGSPPHLSPLRI